MENNKTFKTWFKIFTHADAIKCFDKNETELDTHLKQSEFNSWFNISYLESATRTL